MIKENDLCIFDGESIVYRVLEVVTKQSTAGAYEYTSVIIQAWKRPGGELLPENDRDTFKCSFDPSRFEYGEDEEALVKYRPEMFLFACLNT